MAIWPGSLIGAVLAVSTSCSPSRGTIGAVLARQPRGEVTVREVPRGLASDKAGLKPGDQLLLVDGIDVRGLTPEALHQVLSGDVGTSVRVTVVRGEEVLRMEIHRTPPRPYEVEPPLGSQ